LTRCCLAILTPQHQGPPCRASPCTTDPTPHTMLHKRESSSHRFQLVGRACEPLLSSALGSAAAAALLPT
jgi:hypothetical protein